MNLSPWIAKRRRSSIGAGFTLLEVLVATVVTLILTALVVEMFAVVSDGIFNSRANIEMSDQLRNAKHRLIQDLRGVTAPTVPPLDPCAELGYFEYVEGGNVANALGGDIGGGSTSSGTFSSNNTVTGDCDDILAFTTVSFDDKFVGRFGSANTRKSRFAEVFWFVREVSSLGFCNLHRQVFIIDPQAPASGTKEYAISDISMRQVGGIFEKFKRSDDYGDYEMTPTVDTNSLGDLTMRERRTLHQPYSWPYEIYYTSGGSVMGANVGPDGLFENHGWPDGSTPLLGLPTMLEQSITTSNSSSNPQDFPDPIAAQANDSNGKKMFVYSRKKNVTPASYNPPSLFRKFNLSTAAARREAEDVILTGVIGFDVKAWDPGAPVFRASSAPTDATNVSNADVIGLIIPGDPGYGGAGSKYISDAPKGALQNFIERPTDRNVNHPVAFGAYVDLNYMWLNGLNGRTNITASNSYMNAYLGALRQFELGANVVRKDGYVRLPRPSFAFATPGRLLSGYPGDTTSGYQYPAVYDTWSRHYEYDGIDNDYDGVIDEGTDGLDNNGNGYVDEPPVAIDLSSPADSYIDGYEMSVAERHGERDAPPPYDAPLRGIKVTIRVMEQDSRQVREVSTVHEFIPF